MARPAEESGTPAKVAASSASWFAKALLLLLILAFGGGLGYGIATYLRPAAVLDLPPLRSNATNLPELQLRYQILQNQLDNAAENSKRQDRLLTLLLTLTSLYALALGLSSYFSLKQILESGKEDLGRLREFTAQSRTELRERYPELANLHANLREMLGGIRLMFQPGHDWSKQYADLNEEQREKFRLAELRIASLEVFRLSEIDSFRDDLRRVYQGLGRFYSSKYRDEKGLGDWERALLYFNTALEVDGANRPAELMKDVGVHLTLIEQMAGAGVAMKPETLRRIEPLRSQAEDAFRESLARNPTEPGALFGLGWILYTKKLYTDAIQQYVAVTAISTWAAGEREKYLDNAWSNQACCFSLMGAPDDVFTKALETLEQSKRVAAEYGLLPAWKKKIEREADFGDLVRLKHTKPDELRNILL